MRKFLIGFAVFSVLVTTGLTQVWATSDQLADALAAYPAISGTRIDDCALCHSSIPALNSYGTAYVGAGKNFGAIEGQDSDGDGFSNIVEINALTFPGDASDKPAGGGTRFLGRSTLTPGSVPFALAAATDVDRDEALIVWGESAVEDEAARVEAGLTSMLVDDEGAPIKKAATFGDGAVNEAFGVGAAYAVKKKRFVATWTSPEEAAMAQLLKSKVNKKKGKTLEVSPDATGPMPAWDTDLGQFVVASGTSLGVAVDKLSHKGKVSRHEVGRSASHIITEFANALGFATGMLDSGRLLLATADTTKGAEPGTALLESGSATWVDAGVDKASKKGIGMAAAMADGATGMLALRSGTKVKTGQIDTDGTLIGKAINVKKAKAGVVGVAPQSDGTFLVVWVDAKKGKLLAVDRSADGKTSSKSFELHVDGEDVIPDLLAVVPLGDAVLVVYVTDGEPGEIRTVVVGPAE